MDDDNKFTLSIESVRLKTRTTSNHAVDVVLYIQSKVMAPRKMYPFFFWSMKSKDMHKRKKGIDCADTFSHPTVCSHNIIDTTTKTTLSNTYRQDKNGLPSCCAVEA